MVRHFVARPKSAAVTSNTSVRAARSSSKRPIKCSFRDKDWEKWTVNDYFEYLYYNSDGDLEDAFYQIESDVGNEELPPCVEDMGYLEIERMYEKWASRG